MPEQGGVVIIRQCRATDVDLLEKLIPSPGLSRFHHARFDRQHQGLGTYLIAWVDDVPVGVAETRWDGCAAPEIARHYPDCPELNALTVWPAERQSRGIGTAIIAATENRSEEHTSELQSRGLISY